MDKKSFKNQVDQQPFKPLSDLVYEFLFKDIIRLNMLPETRINETKIANNLEISRSPIRKAVEKLVSEQLVVNNDGKYFVSSFTPNDYLQITQARTFIESEASYLAAKTISTTALEKLKELMINFEESIEDTNLENFEIHDHQIHSHIVYNCGNPFIIEMYDCIQHRVLRYRYHLRRKLEVNILQTTLQSTVKSHWALFHALEIGLASVAKEEAAAHADAMRDVFANW